MYMHRAKYKLELFIMQALNTQNLEQVSLHVHNYTSLKPSHNPPPSPPPPLSLLMADPQYRQDIQTRHQFQHVQADGGPSKSKILAVVTVLPVGGFLLLLSGMTLAGTLIGLALTFPLFVICSPVLVPAALTVALAVAGFLTSGAFGITALSALSWIINHLRKSGETGRMEHVKQRLHDTAGYMGQKAKEMGQKTQEGAKT